MLYSEYMQKKAMSSRWRNALIGAGLGGLGAGLYGYLSDDEQDMLDPEQKMLLYGTLGTAAGGTLGAVAQDIIPTKETTTSARIDVKKPGAPPAGGGEQGYFTDFTDMIKKINKWRRYIWKQMGKSGE